MSPSSDEITGSLSESGLFLRKRSIIRVTGYAEEPSGYMLDGLHEAVGL